MFDLEKKRAMSGVFKTPKETRILIKTIILETTKFILPKHPIIFENESSFFRTMVFLQYLSVISDC